MKARQIIFDAPNYVLRTMKLDDASRDWGSWLADADTAAVLNAPPRTLSVEDRRAYIANFDNETSFLFGVFDKQNDRLVGIWTAYADFKQREALFNLLIGAKEARFIGAATETRDLVYAYFFNELNFTSGRIVVLERNAHMVERVKRHGWVHEHTSQKADAVTGAAVALLHFRLTKESWLAYLRSQAPLQGNHS